MVSFAATIGVLTAVGTGFLAVCATTLATAGWTAPACLVSGIAYGLAGIFAIAHDATHGSMGYTNDPETVTVTATVTAVNKRAVETAAATLPQTSGVWYKVNENGWMEDMTQRMPELYGVNESTTIYHAGSGSYHTVEMREDGTAVRLRTKMNQDAFVGASTKRRRQAESPAGNWGVLSKLLPRQDKSSSLDELIYEASNVVTNQNYPTSDGPYMDAARTIADGAYQLGTYCVTVSDSDGNALINVGMTFDGPNYKDPNVAGPCKG